MLKTRPTSPVRIVACGPYFSSVWKAATSWMLLVVETPVIISRSEGRAPYLPSFARVFRKSVVVNAPANCLTWPVFVTRQNFRRPLKAR